MTNQRLRTTKKGERTAWLTLADGTAAIESSLFPNAYERLGQATQAQVSLREGAFLVALGPRVLAPDEDVHHRHAGPGRQLCLTTRVR